MKIDFRTAFVKMHAHLQKEEGSKNPVVAATAKSHRLLLETLVQQALTNEFLDQSAKLQGTDSSALMQELLNRRPQKREDDENPS